MASDLIMPLIIWAVVFLIGILINSAIIWVASKVFKLKKQDMKTALLTGFALTASLVLYCVFTIAILLIIRSLLFYMVFILASPVFDFIAFVYLVKRFYSESWKNSLLAFTVNLFVYIMIVFVLFLPLLILWQLGAFNPR